LQAQYWPPRLVATKTDVLKPLADCAFIGLKGMLKA
jgi:hypothetical protein